MIPLKKVEKENETSRKNNKRKFFKNKGFQTKEDNYSASEDEENYEFDENQNEKLIMAHENQMFSQGKIHPEECEAIIHTKGEIVSALEEMDRIRGRRQWFF